MNTCKGLFIFLAGAALGTVVTGKVLKTKYEQILEEEIESVKEAYDRRAKRKEKELEEEDDEPIPTKEEVETYHEMVKNSGYTNYSKQSKEVEKEVVTVYTPEVISPDDFDTNGYKTQTLTLYADGVLADEYDNIITNVDEIVGEDSLEHFGEYEEDTVYVRNEERETDYEILRDSTNYSDNL